MNPYCRRAVAQGVSLARETGGTCTVVTLGPPGAEDVLREAVAWGADDGLHACDPAFAGSDTLATARRPGRRPACRRALRPRPPRPQLHRRRDRAGRPRAGRAARPPLRRRGPPAAGPGRRSGASSSSTTTGPRRWSWRCPRCSRWPSASATPARSTPRAGPPWRRRRLTRVDAGQLGPGPWGEAGSPTVVGATRPMEHDARPARPRRPARRAGRRRGPAARLHAAP